MLRYCEWSTLGRVVRRRSKIKVLATALLGSSFLLPTAHAATVDFNEANSNYDSSLDPDLGATPNWLDTTQAVPVAPPAVPPTNAPVSIPANTDDAFVRNNGTATITSAVINNSFWIGSARTVYTDDGVTVIENEAGGNGTVNMTGGSLSGSGPNGLTLRLGGVGLESAGSPVYTGTFVQSGGTVTMGATASTINIGSQGTTPTPTSSYTMSGGEIKMAYATGGNSGINVRNGTFNMSGGSITTDRPAGTDPYGQRVFTISSAQGTPTTPIGATPINAAYANFSGTAVVDSHSGIRVAPNANAAGYVTISGNASLKLGADFQLAANAGNAFPEPPGLPTLPAYGQLDMSGGYLQVGQYTTTDSHFEKRFIVGDAGRGVFNQTGGNVVVGNELRMSNNAVSSALMTMKDPIGGPTGVPFTFTVRGVETRQNATGNAALTSDVIIDSPDATFIQTNMVHPVSGAVLVGVTRIGGNGKSTFEIRQGNVLLGQATGVGANLGGSTDLSRTASARATLNLVGGKLTLGGNVIRSDTSAASKPVVNLTGGQLILNPLTSAAPTSHTWQTDFMIAGSQVTPKAGTVLQVTVGSATIPGNFAMSSGALDIDISSGAITGADKFLMAFPGSTASLTGGTLNLNYISGYTPAVGHSLWLARTNYTGNSMSSITVNPAGVSINANGSPDPNWTVQAVANSATAFDIRLVYVPEPTSCVLAGMALIVGMTGFRRRS